jgi:alginate O-acetyltransferase complex protein AlgI
MLFTELRFFLFFALLLAIYWAIPRNSSRKILLLVASYTFYSVWDWRFLSLILLSTVVDYFAGLFISQNKTTAGKNSWLLVSLTVNLGMLGIFKYFNFFAASFADLFQTIGIEPGWTTLNIVLPVGISFYTFQTLSYTIDVYRKQLEPTRKFLDFALFVAFFPQLVAGPIVRAKDFLYQLDTDRHFAKVDLRWALTLFGIGFIKKACIADNLAPYVDRFYANPATFSLMDSWVAVCAYAAQIYCDFSGYTDMAIAIAGLFGYRLRGNFATPYVATDITDFWRRWHISLSTWLRDYLYIPLGGSRNGKILTYRNLMITMLLGGLWHGASWNFVFWGACHGAGLAIHKIWREVLGAKKMPVIVGTAITLLFVVLLWVPFRAPDTAITWQVWTQLFGADSNAAAGNGLSAEGIAIGIVLATMLIVHFGRNSGVFVPLWRRPPALVFAFGYGLAFSVALALRAVSYQPFIYFQF